MSKRAKEAALKAHPICTHSGMIEKRRAERRRCHEEGYEQGEKETIERAARWIMEFENQLKVRFRITDTEFLEQFRKEMEGE